MTFDVRPADVFDDVRQVIGPKRPDANVCWCLSYRIPSRLNRELRGPARGELVAELCRRDPPPGVLAYDGDVPVGWAGVAPRADLNSFARTKGKIPHVDDQPVWTGQERVGDPPATVAGPSPKAPHVADTDSVLDGFPRVLMRLDLR